MEETENNNYHQVKLDTDAWTLVKARREQIRKAGRHVSFSDTIRQLFIDKDARDELLHVKKYWYFKCQKCGAVMKTEEHKCIPTEPSECFEKQGGCGRVSSFVNVTEDVLRERLGK